MFRMVRWGLCGVLISSSGYAQVVRWTEASGGNGHYYVLNNVEPSFISWDVADAEVASTTLLGATGHLVTITSAEEQAFVEGAFGVGLRGCWMGGIQAEGAAEPLDGWQWITGEPWEYTNWGAGEPSDSEKVNENRLAFRGGLDPEQATWVDTRINGRRQGYVADYPPGACAIADVIAPWAVRDIDDVLIFLGRFSAGLPSADVDGNGRNDIDDVLTFLQSFALPCP